MIQNMELHLFPYFNVALALIKKYVMSLSCLHANELENLEETGIFMRPPTS